MDRAIARERRASTRGRTAAGRAHLEDAPRGRAINRERLRRAAQRDAEVGPARARTPERERKASSSSVGRTRDTRRRRRGDGGASAVARPRARGPLRPRHARCTLRRPPRPPRCLRWRAPAPACRPGIRTRVRAARTDRARSAGALLAASVELGETQRACATEIPRTAVSRQAARGCSRGSDGRGHSLRLRGRVGWSDARA